MGGDITDASASIWLTILFQALEVPVGIIYVCIPTFPVFGPKISQSKFGKLVHITFGKYSALIVRIKQQQADWYQREHFGIQVEEL